MFRVSLVILALASAFALNGCSQCSKQEATEAPAAIPATPEATPADAAAAMPAATPVDGAAAAMPPTEAPTSPGPGGEATVPAGGTPAPAAH